MARPRARASAPWHGVVVLTALACLVAPAAAAPAAAAAAAAGLPTQLDMANFREQTQGHPLSYVLFYTKKGRDWESTLSTFSEACPLLLAEYPGMLCGAVDLDDNAPLTLYTKYNSLDLMIFFPDFVPTPLRFHGRFSPQGILESVRDYARYTNEYMLEWADPKALVDKFMAIKFKGEGAEAGGSAGNVSAVVADARFGAAKAGIYLEFLELLKDDVANLVELSNTLRFKLHNAKDLEKRDAETGVFANEAAFLDLKMRLAFADDFLQQMFPKKQLPRLSLKTSKFMQQKEAASKAQAILDAAARAQEIKEEDELM